MGTFRTFASDRVKYSMWGAATRVLVATYFLAPEGWFRDRLNFAQAKTTQWAHSARYRSEQVANEWRRVAKKEAEEKAQIETIRVDEWRGVPDRWWQ